jgi:hypothetical protein
MSLRRCAVVIAFLSLTNVCRAETWVEVKHGGFPTPPEALAQVKATLEQTVVSAPGAAKQPVWNEYLIQYRGTTIHDLRVLEIHGSCRFESPGFNTRLKFYDAEVSDGGACYFMVYFVIKTQRYSNVMFHGLA